MIDDRSVPLVVLIVGIAILVAVRLNARSSNPIRRRRDPEPGPDAIARLAEHLGVGILVEEVESGPPAHIVATGLLDGGTTRLTGSGATEAEAWDDLARAAIAWKRDDGRIIRTYIGGP